LINKGNKVVQLQHLITLQPVKRQFFINSSLWTRVPKLCEMQTL